jgi:hypothetical protein
MRVDGVANLAVEVERGLRLRAVEVWDVRLVDADNAVTAVVRRVSREKLMDSREGPRDFGQVEDLIFLPLTSVSSAFSEPRYGVPNVTSVRVSCHPSRHSRK